MRTNIGYNNYYVTITNMTSMLRVASTRVRARICARARANACMHAVSVVEGDILVTTTNMLEQMIMNDSQMLVYIPSACLGPCT